MKKVVLALIIGLAIVASFQIFGDEKTVNLSPIFNPVSTPISAQLAGVDVNYKDQTYRAVWIKVTDASKVELTSNFEKKLAASELKMQNSCNSLVSGGFYSKEDTPLGLLISKGYTESDYRTNDLFNGIFGISYGEEPFLGTSFPTGSTRIAIQSGPVLMEDSVIQKLNLKNDEYARRNVVALTDKNEVIFLSLYSTQMEYQGPELVNLPEIVSEFAKLQSIIITDALNLDGGSASAFYTDNVTLQELSYIGSYFCIK